MRPDDLAAIALTGLPAEAPGLDRAAIGDVVWGNASGVAGKRVNGATSIYVASRVGAKRMG
ncbi:hypothetical protein GCM10018966_049260 [Streptomyces yanii]|uniref:Uncharacterized protein n=1 Tax=Streptomyces yanii TaxID=78510 RepID=A0ABV5RIS3_9ACTN